jgi:SAM-dependent methyltransferase
VTREYAVYHAYSLEPFLDRVAASRGHVRALDVGCGTGVVTLALARRHFDVVGVDHSPEMLAIAARKLKEEGLSARCRLERADVRSLRFDDAEFACVTCQGLLHHLEELEPCLAEMARVLAPGGFFYISEPCRDETVLKRLLLAGWRWLARRRPSLAPEQPASFEAPIASANLRGALDRLGLHYKLEYLTHLPPLRRRLPDRPYLLVTRILSFPWRRRKGDLLFVYGKKPDAPRTSRIEG